MSGTKDKDTHGVSPATQSGEGGEDSRKIDIQSLRAEINGIDSELLEIIAKRRGLSLRVVESKHAGSSSIRDREREEELLVDRIQKGRSHGLSSNFVTRIFHEIIDDSVRLQRERLQDLSSGDTNELNLIRVAFQGGEGAYSYLAGEKYFARYGDSLSLQGCSSFKEVMEAVEKGQVDYGILPIENTTSGGINEVYDLLMHTQLAIVGEEKFKVSHCLLGLESAGLEDIKKLYCHPQTVLQCGQFLSEMKHWRIEYFMDTALSGKRIKEEGKKSQAAIASKEAARIFGLSVLKENIANQAENYTRFLVAARKPIPVDIRIPCKTSIVMATSHEPGSLVETLLIFKENGINLTKLESRPILENPWEEMFYIDFEGNREDPKVRKTLDDITKKARFIRVLGTYPTEEVSPTPVSAEMLAGINSEQKTEDSGRIVVADKPKTKKSSNKGYRLVSRDYKNEDTVIEVKGVKIGGDNFSVIAGPCSVESAEQIISCAREVRESGGVILRGGCFKPRTSPYSFQGLGLEGVDLLVKAGREFGLPVITEVLSPDDVEDVAERSDMLQVGARNMQNFTLLSAVGRTSRPVMLKRGMSSSIEELLNAAEYILDQGNQQVILCERGIRTFETATRNTLDISAVPVLRARTHLPIFIDPSHAAGKRELVEPLSIAARAVGAHGIMVEIHPEPEKALSDGPQSLRFGEFKDLMGKVLK